MQQNYARVAGVIESLFFPELVEVTLQLNEDRLKRLGLKAHSAANVAKEMGENLIAASAGLGKGATFTLELPVVK